MKKAIETRYKDCRFRSRLEARWAVFFDAIGVPWEYEKEGYHLPSGMYLPDFWLPTVRLWAEVKPESFLIHERRLCQELSEATGFRCLLLDGLPDHRCYWDAGTSPSPVSQATYGDPFVELEYDLSQYVDMSSKDGFFCSPDEDGTQDRPTRITRGNLQFDSAVRAARSARFEFGEHG